MKQYSVNITYKSKRSSWPTLRGEIFEDDVLIGKFSRAAVVNRFIPPIEYKFYSTAAKNRFDDYADCLSIEETIESLLPL